MSLYKEGIAGVDFIDPSCLDHMIRHDDAWSIKLVPVIWWLQ